MRLTCERVRRAAALVYLVVLASCGGDDGTIQPATPAGESATTVASAGSSAATTPDPCTLLTLQEVSTAVGSPVEAELTVLPAPVGGKSCLFSNTDAPPIKTVQITVRTTADLGKALRDQGSSVERLYEDTKNLSKQSGTATEDVSGLGDKAYKTSNAYYVLKKGVSLDSNLGLNANPSAQAQNALKTLTEKAVSRL